MTRRSSRLLLAALVAVACAAVVFAVDREDPASESRGGIATPRAAKADRLLVEVPASLREACAAAQASGTVLACPPAIPRRSGGWGRVRLLDDRRCEALIDVEPDLSAPPGDGPFHLLLGARCKPFDLSTRRGRWPVPARLERDLRLVGSRPLKPGESGRLPALRPLVVDRVRVADRRGLLLRYPPEPLASVHTGHLAIVWNEPTAAYAVSAHPPDDSGSREQERTVRALWLTARGMHDAATGPVERIYLGVSCPEPNSVRCDRVGLYVWLSRPARRVVAYIEGRRLALRAQTAPSLRPGTAWEGFLEDAGLDDGPLRVRADRRGRWFGEPAVRARVRLSLRLPDATGPGHVLLRPRLHPGYG